MRPPQSYIASVLWGVATTTIVTPLWTWLVLALDWTDWNIEIACWVLWILSVLTCFVLGWLVEEVDLAVARWRYR